MPELIHGFRVIDSFESERIITSICEEYNEDNNLQGRSQIRYWDFNHVATPNGIDVIVQNNQKASAAKKIIESYYRFLDVNNQIDFEQILFYSFKLLKKK